MEPNDLPHGEDSKRYLTADGVQQYLQSSVSGQLYVEGNLPAYLVIDASRKQVSVQVLAEGVLPDVSRYRHLNVDTVRFAEKQWHRLTVVTDHKFQDLYPILCLVLDGVQLRSRSFASAVNDAIEAYHDVLLQRRTMSETDEIGLFGELLVLEHLSPIMASSDAVSAWLGALKEEHDFSLLSFDVEVKTTTNERRVHWISTLTQLEPKPGIPLFLLSVQLTRAGSAVGSTLADLVAKIRSAFPDHLGVLNERFDRSGYRDTDADLYTTNWVQRRAPTCYLVDDAFPALTPARVVEAVPHPHRIIDLRYRLDLEGYVEVPPPDLFLGFVTDKKEVDR
jgi:hypothetical protein